MSWRVVVVTKSAKLEYSMEYLVVRGCREHHQGAPW